MASGKPPKLLIANRGEIALRIMRSAKALSIPTVSIYTLADASSPHVFEAEESYPIGDGNDPRGYLNIDGIVEIIQKSRATMVAPGYGFLSENAAFATAVEALGVTFLGPTPTQMTSMGLKHEARAVAIKAGVPVVPGSEGAVNTLENAVKIAGDIGYPILVKASGGGGGMGMQICRDEQDLIDNFDATKAKGQNLFKDPTVFIEKFIIHARHVEVQIFGNGEGHVVHMGERECSVQRRHQKVIEEAPCVLLGSDMGKDVRKRMCEAAVKLGELMNYRSAGTVEFVLDVDSPHYDFYFLELNARIQVEHAITEVTHPGLDLVALMIRQGLSPNHSLPPSDLRQEDYIHFEGHSIEARIYCENPKANFKPCPGQLHEVVWADVGKKGRIDTWVKTGTTVTPHYDPMIAKLVVYGETREEAIHQMLKVLDASKIIGPTTNLDYCKTILRTDGRFVGLGIPRGGAADMLALQAANILVGNDKTTEGLEMTMMGAKLLFHVSAIVAITGCETDVTLDEENVEMWSSLGIKAGQTLRVGNAKSSGLRSYLAVRGGIHNVSSFEGSKSTFTGAALGGYQGRALLPTDLLTITPFSLDSHKPQAWPSIPKYGNVWGVNVCQGPQWDKEFIASEGMKTLLESQWKVTPASNRSGLRLEGPRVKWARKDGGEGGGHPSNVIDQGYPFAALNMNGDTPVLFGVDAPDMGGFSCALTVSVADLWKLGQIRPGDMVKFEMIDPTESEYLLSRQQQWLNALQSPSEWVPSCAAQRSSSIPSTSILHQDRKPDGSNVLLRTAGDRFILYEVGAMALDLSNRVRVELWDRAMRAANIKGVINYNVAVRSAMVQFDPTIISRNELLRIMVEKDKKLENTEDVQLDITTWKFPVVVDDRWCREAVEFYMKSARKEAVYLPSNVEYMAKNNGLPSTAVFDALTKTPWLVLARGFFVMLPFIILDPRHRLVAQKYNPPRTRTPEGAVGLAGVIGAIYPIESAGGYQLLGRTLTPWNAWAEKKCLLDNFDQIEFYPVSEDEFVEFMASHEKEVEEFKKKQKEASEVLTEKEEALFAQYAAENEKLAAAGHHKAEGVEEGVPIASPLPASVYKILINVGDTIKSDEQNLVELEAMKTSVSLPQHIGNGLINESKGVSPCWRGYER
ncbi:urea carboxylase [Cryptococcus gattii Ru294]|nr:urea carboxylase [Cryptococcus gattii Ru294]